MMKLAVTFALLALASAALPSFEEFLDKYDKSYTAEELPIRRRIYEKTVRMIEAHNAAGTSKHVKGVNHMSDWTETEFSAMLGFDHTLHRHRALGRAENSKFRDSPVRPRHLSLGSLPVPESVDWAKANATTPVKNQGGCGSCWAFAGTEAIESNVFLETGHLIELAPQYYVDCVANSDQCGGKGGCEGSVPDLLFEFATRQGARDPKDYPYKAERGVCNAGHTLPTAGITGWVDVISNDPVALMLAVAKQPIAIGVAASAWATYQGGVLTFEECDPIINHAVLLVGYGTDPELGDYWTVQNSWGPGWGEGGFIRVERNMTAPQCVEDTKPLDGLGCRGGPDSVTVCGACGILYASNYPVGGHVISN